jgi:hypothetical protein
MPLSGGRRNGRKIVARRLRRSDKSGKVARVTVKKWKK